MLKVIAIHGTYGSPDENWFPWLRDKVLKTGNSVQIPSFPTPERQSLESWRRSFDEQIGKVGDHHILVGHSLGATFICDILQRSESAIRASFFVSGFSELLGNPEFDTLNETFVVRNYDWDRIRRNMGQAHAYFGDNDPYVGRDRAERFASNLGIRPVAVKEGGHLNSSAGYSRFDPLWSDLEPLLLGP
jgi:predicted alpha/beta hydrolase family esterase